MKSTEAHGVVSRSGKHYLESITRTDATMRWIAAPLFSTLSLVILLAACETSPTSQPTATKQGRAQLLIRVAGSSGRTERPVRVRVVLRNRTGLAYDVSHSFPTQASGDDIATFFERSFNGCGFRAFRSTRSVFVEPVYETGANCSHDSVEVTFGRNSAELVKRVPLTRPAPPGT